MPRSTAGVIAGSTRSSRNPRPAALRIDDALVELDVGDAVLFEPDRELHRVSRVVGTRLLIFRWCVDLKAR